MQISEDKNQAEAEYRYTLTRVRTTKKTVKSNREMAFSDIADLSIFRVAQRELGFK